MPAAISCTVAGSKEAPHASGVGNTVACQAASPVRHSSCAIAGMPRREPATMPRWVAARTRAPVSGSTGAVPKTRVRWPRPGRVSTSHGGSGSANSCWWGATSSPSPIVVQTP